MKVEYLFSKNSRVGSKVIAWASSFEDLSLDDIPSHVAVLLDGTYVVESVLGRGVRMIPYHKWLEINTELYRIPCIQVYTSRSPVLVKLLDVWGKKYDWCGILYFGLMFLRLMAFKTRMPKTNAWESKDKYFCTEFAGKLSGASYEMTTPAKMCDTILKEIDSEI